MPRHKDSERERVLGETRQRLIDAATHEFAREGFTKANVDRISRAAGFGKGTIYNYFDSKRALMAAVIDELSRAHVEFMAAAVQQESDPTRRLQCFFEAGFAFVRDHFAQLQVMINTIYGPDAGFKEYLYAAYQPMFRLVEEEIVAAGMARGAFRPVDPRAMALLIMTIYLGTGSQIDERGRIWQDPGQIADFCWHALRQSQSNAEER
jgi:AcrR family transcriptional regulator